MVCCSVVKHVCSVLQCVAVCCSVLQVGCKETPSPRSLSYSHSLSHQTHLISGGRNIPARAHLYTCPAYPLALGVLSLSLFLSHTPQKENSSHHRAHLCMYPLVVGVLSDSLRFFLCRSLSFTHTHLISGGRNIPARAHLYTCPAYPLALGVQPIAGPRFLSWPPSSVRPLRLVTSTSVAHIQMSHGTYTHESWHIYE